MLDAPQVVLTPNSSFSLRINWNAVIPARLIAPTGIIKGSTTTSLALIPKSRARSTIFFATFIIHLFICTFFTNILFV